MTAEIQKRLMVVAKKQAESLERRENVVAITLYGSLVAGDVTPFSDIDIIAVIEGEEPPYFTEHRIINGMKVDIKPYSIDSIKRLAENIPQSLHSESYASAIFLESIMLGDSSIILYDPDAKLSSIRDFMHSQTSYRKLAIPDARKEMDRIEKERWPSVTAAYEKGSYGECVDRTKGIAFRWLSDVLDLLAGYKDVFIAIERLGIPEVGDDYRRLESLCPLPSDSVERFHSALKEAWEYSLGEIYEPLKKALFDAGVPEPEKLELICNHRAFLPYFGCRCMELGRAIAETNLSLRWMKSHIDEGEYDRALHRIRFAWLPDGLEQQWENISKAIKYSGYDVSELINRTLQSDGYKQKVELARKAEKIERKRVHQKNAEMAIQCVQNIRAAIERIMSNTHLG